VSLEDGVQDAIGAANLHEHIRRRVRPVDAYRGIADVLDARKLIVIL
jgi:hypothetical protein